MVAQNVGFAFIAIVMVIAALRVVTTNNVVHAALWLVVVLSGAAALYVLLAAEFLAVTQVLVYVGAVMVLFLMMLDIHIDTIRKGFWKNFPLAATLGAIVAFEMAAVLLSGFRLSEAPAMAPGAAPVDNGKALGILLYTEYLMPIQIAAAILLVAMVAAIALTLRSRKDSKAIDASIQVKVRAADRMQVGKMAPTQAAPAPVAASAEDNK